MENEERSRYQDSYTSCFLSIEVGVEVVEQPWDNDDHLAIILDDTSAFRTIKHAFDDAITIVKTNRHKRKN